MKKNWKSELAATALIAILFVLFFYVTWWKVLIALTVIAILGMALTLWVFWELFHAWGDGDDEDYYKNKLENEQG